MSQPPNLAVLLQGATAYLQEVKQALEQAGIRCWTGPLPGTT
jgi:hypothetical protein